MKKIISLLIVMIMALSFIFSNGVSAETQLLGDTNGDKVIDNKDVVTLFRGVSGISIDIVKENCDVNSDKEIDNKDVVMIFRYVSENWPHFHQYGEWTIIKEATCTEQGKRERVCTCGDKQIQIIEATGHSWVEATCTKPRNCINCGLYEGTALGHSYQNGICTRCGEGYPIVELPEELAVSYCNNGWARHRVLLTRFSYVFSDDGYLVITYNITYDSDSGSSGTFGFSYELQNEDGTVLYSDGNYKYFNYLASYTDYNRHLYIPPEAILYASPKIKLVIIKEVNGY